MLTFLNGPAAEVKGLLVIRAPRLLRVVFDVDKKAWDVLDQLDDKPKFTEDIYAYRRVKYEGTIHMRTWRCSGCFCIATYEFVEPQPDERTMRYNGHWQKWATEEATRNG